MNGIHFTADKISVHFVEPEMQMRAELAGIGLSLGYHCEIYCDFSEIAKYPPRSGIIVVRDCPELGGIGSVLDRLTTLGISLPVVAMDFEPTPSQVVKAIKEGALDFLVLPLRAERLAGCLAKIADEVELVSEERRRKIYAQRQLAALSPREREVLNGVTNGGSNKEIARQLQISPRTVEIHRANMMQKLGLRHAVEAVRLKLESGSKTISMRLPQAA